LTATICLDQLVVKNLKKNSINIPAYIGKLTTQEVEKELSHPVFKVISEIAGRENLETYVIGGFVRDIFLGRSSKDIDIVVIGNGIDLARKVARSIGKHVNVTVFKNFGTAMLKYKDSEIEFVGARKESYDRSSRKPVVENGTLDDDQKRRDFTINALAFNLHPEHFGEMVDPFNGIGDLQERTIKTPLEPGTTFSDDPLRMIRAIRFATQLHFRIEESTLNAIGENKERIKIVSKERIVVELHKMILSAKPSIGFKLLEETGLLQIIFPEFASLKGIDEKDGKRHKDNFYHTLEVVDNICKTTDKLWLRWSAMLHDIAKPPTKRYYPDQGWTFHGHEFLGAKMVPGIFKRLRMPLNEKMKFVQKMVLLHLRPIVLAEDFVSDSAVRRLLFDAGDDIEDLMTLAEADITSKNEVKVQKYLRNFKIVRKKMKEIEEKDAVRNFQPPVSGELIMETFGLPPSREIGLIKDAIKDAILDGEIKNDYDEAYAFMLKRAELLGLKPVSNN
jgi:poly(A) polymerase